MTLDSSDTAGAGHRGWRAWLPALVLVVVALIQVALAKTGPLTPWKGGGFGMFATTDGTAFRYVRVFIDAPGRSQELDIVFSLERSAARAQLFPATVMLRRLAEDVVARERRYGRAVSSVRVEVWRTEFNGPSLQATDRQLQSLTYHAD